MSAHTTLLCDTIPLTHSKYLLSSSLCLSWTMGDHQPSSIYSSSERIWPLIYKSPWLTWESVQIQQNDDSYVTCSTRQQYFTVFWKTTVDMNPVKNFSLFWRETEGLRIPLWYGDCMVLNVSIESMITFVSVWNKHWMPSIPRYYCLICNIRYEILPFWWQ